MELSDFIFSAEGGYPSTVGVTPNARDAKLLANVFAGKGSEMTALTQYMYQAMQSGRLEREIATVFEEIALVEMRHYDMLGQAITNLGGTPYVAGLGGWWRGDYVYYSAKLSDMLTRDIRDEELAILDYKKLIQVVSTPEVADLLARIIMDEEKHIIVLTSLKQQLEFRK